MLRIDSLYQFLMQAPTQEQCIKHLEEVIWQNVPVSPFSRDSKVYTYKNGRYRCKNTGKYFNVLNGTMFENTKLPLTMWFTAILLITVENKGITSVDLAKNLQITQKSAWFLLQRIRACCKIENNNVLFGTVEMDETSIGGTNGNRHVKNRKTQDENWGKTWAFGMVERGGKVNVWAVPDRFGKSLMPLIKKYVQKGSRVITDKLTTYNSLHKTYAHTSLNHDAYEFVSLENKSHHNNTIESLWNSLKSSVERMYNHVSDKHLQLYIDEWVYRQNTKDYIISDKVNWLLLNSGVRTRYKDLIA